MNFKITPFLFGGFVVILGTTSTQAGFEWVPPDPAPVVASPIVESPPPAPVIVLEPVAVTPALPVPQEPGRSAIVLPPSVSGPNNPPLLLPPKLETDVQTIGSTKPLEKAPPPPLPVPDASQIEAAPVYIPPPSRAEPTLKRQRIIVPKDAPASAIEKTSSQGEVEITAAPADKDLKMTAVTPMPSPDDPPPAGKEKVHGKMVETFVAKNPNLNSGDVMISPAPLAAAPIIPAAPAPVIVDNAVGFGSDVPLALALQQVVPADFAYSFDPAVNVGSKVSWNGGKAWNLVVADMVAPLGYSLRIEGKVVHIMPGKSAKVSSSIEPASGAPQKIGPSAPVQNIQRINVTDPGGENAKSQPEETLEKIKEAS